MSVRLNYATIETVNALIEQGLERETAETLVQQFSNQEHDNVYSVKEIDKMMADTVREVFNKSDSQMREVFDKSDAKFESFRKEQREEQRREFDDVLRKHKKDAWVVAGTLGSTILVGFISVAIAVYFGLK